MIVTTHRLSFLERSLRKVEKKGVEHPQPFFFFLCFFFFSFVFLTFPTTLRPLLEVVQFVFFEHRFVLLVSLQSLQECDDFLRFGECSSL